MTATCTSGTTRPTCSPTRSSGTRSNGCAPEGHPLGPHPADELDAALAGTIRGRASGGSRRCACSVTCCCRRADRSTIRCTSPTCAPRRRSRRRCSTSWSAPARSSPASGRRCRGDRRREPGAAVARRPRRLPPRAGGRVRVRWLGGQPQRAGAARQASTRTPTVAPPIQVAATTEVHASVRVAARVMDVGVVGTTGGTITAGRRRGTARALAAGWRRRVRCRATSGTTNAGVIDELTRIADVCAEHGVWMHVDGAYGGAALCSPSGRALLAGIERADSFGVDPHKWLFAPYDCAALIYRDPRPAARRTPSTATTSTPSTAASGTRRDYAYHLIQTGARPAVVVLARHLRHRRVPRGGRHVDTTPPVPSPTRSSATTGSLWCCSRSCRWCCSPSTGGTGIATSRGAARARMA